MRLTTRTDQFCFALECKEPATFYDDAGSGFYCEPCAVAFSHEPPTTRVEVVQAEVGAAGASVGVPAPLAHEIPGTPGGDYRIWVNNVPAAHVHVPLAYGAGWASGHSAGHSTGWKAGMAYAIARQAEGTL